MQQKHTAALAVVLESPPLRDAVYRQRTPSHALRRAVALTCVPLLCFPAVGPWLSPWDIVPPQDACAVVTSLDLNVINDADLMKAAIAMHAAVSTTRASAREDCSGASGVAKPVVPRPFSKVQSLSVQAPRWIHNDTAAHSIRLILQCLPALRSLAVNRLVGARLPIVLFSARDGVLPFASPASAKHHVLNGEAVQAFRGLPRELTSLDLRDCTLDKCARLFFDSVILCRGTLRTVTSNSPSVITYLSLPKPLKGQPKKLPLRLLAKQEAPTASELPAAIQLTPEGQIPVDVVGRVPVHWTLEKLVVREGHYRGFNPSLGELIRLMFTCPRLHVVNLCYAPIGRPRGALVRAWLYHRVSLKEPSTVWSKMDNMKFGRVTGLLTEEVDAITVAHCYVKAVVDAYASEPSILPPPLAQHKEALDRIVRCGEYPAALLWALCRGPDHTALTTLDLEGPVAAEDPAAVAAVVALAARMRRTQRRLRAKLSVRGM